MGRDSVICETKHMTLWYGHVYYQVICKSRLAGAVLFSISSRTTMEISIYTFCVILRNIYILYYVFLCFYCEINQYNTKNVVVFRCLVNKGHVSSKLNTPALQ